MNTPACAAVRGSGLLRSSLDPPCAPWRSEIVGTKGVPPKSTPKTPAAGVEQRAIV
jgi:hypothetical protein